VGWKSVNTWKNPIKRGGKEEADNYYDNEFDGGDTDSWISRDDDTYMPDL